MRAHAGTEVLRVLGHRMLAQYHRPAGSERRRFPAALFLHGFPGSEKNVDVQRELMKRGIASLSPSFLGAWGSGGSYRFTTLVPQAAAALDRMKKLPFVDPRRVAVFGFSMGAWTALNLAGADRSLRAAVAVAPCGGPEMLGPGTRSFLAHLSRPLNAPKPAVLLADFRAAMRRFDPASAVPKLNAPLLLIHGDADDTIPVAVSRRLAALAPRGTRLVVEHGADHGFLDRREKLTRLAAGWIAERI
ncbi:MAG: alpha/beta fold hydrolase [Elusimicrobia bacterium]|nr:alpha/beta fold hydrolase [Elusimicrobiota bacterium]MDE2509673.1 alpha/beta fold hydrolase [Elusimicrobiota bacterium]